MMFDPGTATTNVSAANRDQLLQKMQEFGAQLGRACEVSQQHLGRRPGFMKLPYRVKCCTDNIPDEEWGHRVCNENIERMRAEKAGMEDRQ
jgi:hypothetical protein